MPTYRTKARDKCAACRLLDPVCCSTEFSDGYRAAQRKLCTCGGSTPETVEAVRLVAPIKLDPSGPTNERYGGRTLIATGEWLIVGPGTAQRFMSDEEFRGKYEAVE